MIINGTTFAIDFDGTVVTHDYPHIGRDIGAVPVLKRIVAEGGKLILWTMRSGDALQAAVDWYVAQGIPLFGIQRNPEQDIWTDRPKCYAKVYIDDAALGCPLVHGKAGERPYVDWAAVEILLFGSVTEPLSCGLGQVAAVPVWYAFKAQNLSYADLLEMCAVLLLNVADKSKSKDAEITTCLQKLMTDMRRNKVIGKPAKEEIPISRGESGNDGFHCDECGLWTSENQRARTHTDTYHICQGCAASA